MKNVYHVRTKQHRGIKSSLSQSRNSTISQSLCAGAPYCWKLQSAAKVKLFNNCVKWSFWAIFVAAMVKLQQFAVSEAD